MELDVADDGLATFVDVDMFDRDLLLTLAAVLVERFEQNATSLYLRSMIRAPASSARRCAFPCGAVAARSQRMRIIVPDAPRKRRTGTSQTDAREASDPTYGRLIEQRDLFHAMSGELDSPSHAIAV